MYVHPLFPRTFQQKLKIQSHEERRFTFEEFAILALLSSAVICWRFPNKRYKRPTITYDNCGLAKLVTSNRLQINLTYNNNMDCTVVLGLPETRAVKLSIDNFQVSVIHHHQILVHFKILHIFFIFQSKLHYDYIKL